MELLTALVMGQPSLACDACVVRGGCPEPRPPPQRVVVTERLHQSANRRRVLPHAELKQAGPRRLASSSSTALGVAVRIRGSFASCGYCWLRAGIAKTQSSAIRSLKCTYEQGADSFRPLVSTAARCDRSLGRREHLAAGSLICTCCVPPRRRLQARIDEDLPYKRTVDEVLVYTSRLLYTARNTWVVAAAATRRRPPAARTAKRGGSARSGNVSGSESLHVEDFREVSSTQA